MGTQMQSKTYFPGYYSMRDLNNNAGNGMWACYNEDKTLKNGHFYASFLESSSMDGYIGYDKEKARQIMLKHESIFRNQLQELHRLYRKQKDLMNELHIREVRKHLFPAEASKSSICLSQTPFEDANNTWNVSDFPLVGSTVGRLLGSGAGFVQTPCSFTNGKSTCSPLSSHGKVLSRNCGSLKPNCNKFQRKIIDLELPAEVYTNNEAKQEGKRFCESPGSGLNSDCNGDALRSKLSLKRTHYLADLNEPITEKEASITESVNKVGGSTCLGVDTQKRDIFADSNSGSRFWSKEFSQSCLGGKNGSIILNNRLSESDGNGNGQLTYKSKLGETRIDDHPTRGSISGDYPSTLFRSLQVEPRKAHETLKFPPSGNSNKAPQRKRTIFGVEISEGGHNLCLGSQAGVKQLQGCLDLNISVVTPQIFQSRVVAQQDSALADIERKYCSGDQIKPKEIIYQMNMDSLQNHSQHFFNIGKMTKGPFKDLTSAAGVIESIGEKADNGGSKNSRKSLGSPIVNVPQISKEINSSRSPFENLIRNSESVSRHEVKESVAENGLNNYSSVLRHQIDLNLSLNEEEVPSAHSLPMAVVKIATTEIDLEAPAIIQSDMELTTESDRLEKNDEMCPEFQLDDLARVAAEAIIDISLSKSDVIEHSSQFPEASPADSLLCLAEVISSFGGSANDACVEENIPEGMDYFEFMTLKLVDTKEEDYYHKPCFSENLNDEEKGSTSEPKRARKGQGRRRKDFQRDILPGLVSLSRHEVTEDLHTIEDIFKVCGYTWQSSISRRRAARSGRGRTRSRGFPLSQEASEVCLSTVQQYRELEVEDKILTGWGKRTRRLPRQRGSTGNRTPVLNADL